MATLEISSSLEDYLETIYQLVQDQGFARVKEIANARAVKAASVSVALRKLADLGLVRYERREYIALTERGEELGRRVFSRHQLLTRFFEEVLQMQREAAVEQACAMEHSLSNEGMDRLARFFEFMHACPSVPDDLLKTFRSCPLAGETQPVKPAKGCARGCGLRASLSEPKLNLGDLKPGQRGKVTQIEARGAIRQRLLDMGILPDALLDLERVGPSGDPVWIRCQGAQLALRLSEARTILVRPA